MVRIDVNGDLGALIRSFVDSFKGALATDLGGIVSLTAGLPWGVSLNGSGLRIPDAGSDFMTGTVTRMELDEIVLGSSMQVIDRLTLREFSASASTLFDLVERDGFGSSGRFDEAAFRKLLSAPMTVQGGSGADVVVTGNGWVAFKGNDTIRTDAGDDKVDAGLGRDRIEGGDGRDRLKGGEGDDALYGGTGDDLLTGGVGLDKVWGGAGADTFVIEPGAATDEVMDWGAGDRLDLPNGVERELRDRGADLVVAFDGGAVLLRGVEPGELTADSFV